MKQIYLWFGVIVSIAFCSCSHTITFGVGHDYARCNADKRLMSEEYKIVRVVSGEAKAVYFLGIGGLSDDAKKLYQSSCKDMIYNAHLKPNQALIDVTSEMRIALFPFVGVRTIHTTGTVIEFTNSEKLPSVVDDNQYSSQSTSQQGKITPTITKSPYKVGDLYSNRTKQGVVVSVSDDGKHGKIISLKQSKSITAWATKYSYVGAIDEFNGKANSKLISETEISPATKKCNSEGADWYLPSLVEIQNIYKNIDVINKALLANGATPIEVFEQYWTSTEKDSKQAIAITSTYHTFVDKLTELKVISMSDF